MTSFLALHSAVTLVANSRDSLAEREAFTRAAAGASELAEIAEPFRSEVAAALDYLASK